MATSKTRHFPLTNYPSGTHTFTKSVSKGLANFLIEIGRCTTATPTIWPNASTEVSLKVVPSFDGGTTFDEAAIIGFSGAKGGILLNVKTGQELAVQDIGGRYHPNEPTAVKLTVTVLNGPIRTYVDVTAEV